MRRSRPYVPLGHYLPLLAVVSAAALLAACGSDGSPAPSGTVGPTPSAAATGSNGPSLTPVPDGSTSPGTSTTVSQTDTDWGRIWDALPAGFPRYPGSVPTETGQSGPVSAEFDVPDGAEPIVTWLQTALEGAGYSTEALSGPLEDGSRVIDSVADGGCRIQTVVTPLAGTTRVTVRFGADCPFG